MRSILRVLPVLAVCALTACAQLEQLTRPAEPRFDQPVPGGSRPPSPSIPAASSPLPQDPMAQQMALDEQRRVNEERLRRREEAEIAEMARESKLNQARIALDLLDRMYARCDGGQDPVACATFQAHWGELSQQLRQVVEDAELMP